MELSDGEIYRKAKSGISLRIMADLNGVSVKEIKMAFASYAEYEETGLPKHIPYAKWKRAKTKGIAQNASTPPKSSTTKKSKAQSKKAPGVHRYSYSSRIQKRLDSYLLKGMTTAVIYEKLFGLEDCAPAYGGFRERCCKRRKELGVAPLKKTKEYKEKERALMLEQLREEREKVKTVVLPTYITGKPPAEMTYSDVTINDELKARRTKK